MGAIDPQDTEPHAPATNRVRSSPVIGPTLRFLRAQAWAAWVSLASSGRIAIEREIRELVAAHTRLVPDNLMQYGFKAYSQCDEDGILQEIFRRIGDGRRTFVEIGCGDGLENNTHYLLLTGWRGAWIDGDARSIDRARRALAGCDPAILSMHHARVEPTNVDALVAEAMAALGIGGDDLDLLSLDIDGNDHHVLAALTAARPRVIVTEYNAKFPPPVEIVMRHDPAHRWDRSDHFGASLAAFCRLLWGRGYVLVACGISGANAFFVRHDQLRDIREESIERLYQPARGHLTRRISDHPSSYGFLRDRLLGPG